MTIHDFASGWVLYLKTVRRPPTISKLTRRRVRSFGVNIGLQNVAVVSMRQMFSFFGNGIYAWPFRIAYAVYILVTHPILVTTRTTSTVLCWTGTRFPPFQQDIDTRVN
jgi:hypothetical protein